MFLPTWGFILFETGESNPITEQEDFTTKHQLKKETRRVFTSFSQVCVCRAVLGMSVSLDAIYTQH